MSRTSYYTDSGNIATGRLPTITATPLMIFSAIHQNGISDIVQIQLEARDADGTYARMNTFMTLRERQA